MPQLLIVLVLVALSAAAPAEEPPASALIPQHPQASKHGRRNAIESSMKELLAHEHAMGLKPQHPPNGMVSQAGGNGRGNTTEASLEASRRIETLPTHNEWVQWVVYTTILGLTICLSTSFFGFLRFDYLLSTKSETEELSTPLLHWPTALARYPASLDDWQQVGFLAVAVGLALVAVCTLPIAYATGKLTRTWVRDDYLCFVSYNGVTCNNTYVKPRWIEHGSASSPSRRKAIENLTTTYIDSDPFVYLGILGQSPDASASFAVFCVWAVVAVAIHWWRTRMAPGDSSFLTTTFPAAEMPYGPPPPPDQFPRPDIAAEHSWIAKTWTRMWTHLHQRAPGYLWRDWAQPILIGLAVGACMAMFQKMLQVVMRVLWTYPTMMTTLPPKPISAEVKFADFQRYTSPIAIILIPAITLCLSAAIQGYLKGGSAGNFVAAICNNSHIDSFRALVSTTVVSIIAIASGGSAGPEGPILFIGAGLALLTRLPRAFCKAYLYARAEDDSNPVAAAARQAHRWWTAEAYSQRSLSDDALIGGCCSIAAFFDHPISGCLFTLELPHMHGSFRRGEVLPAAMVACVASWYIHRLLMDKWTIADPPVFPQACSPPVGIWYAVPLGLFSGLVSYLFVRFRFLLDALPFYGWAKGLVFGTLIGLIGLYSPDSFTWGEYQLEILANSRDALGPGPSTVLAVAKLFAIVLTCAHGYQAGIIYPLIMVGYLFGPMAAGAMDPNHVFGADYCNEPQPRLSAVGHELLPRSIAAEVFSQCLGSGVLAGVMRAPIGVALHVSFMGRSRGARAGRSISPPFICMLVITNLIAVHVNPLSGLGKVYGSQETEPPASGFHRITVDAPAAEDAHDEGIDKVGCPK